MVFSALTFSGAKEEDLLIFNKLFELYYAFLCSFVLRLGHNQSQAEFIVNCAFHELWKNRLTIKFVKESKEYLFNLVMNNSINSAEIETLNNTNFIS